MTSPTQIDELENFIDKHRGKLVRINVNIAEEQSRILDVGGKGVQLASVACTEDKFSDCATSTLLLKGDDYTFGWYKGNNQLSGYFVIDDQVEMHQGPVYGLKGVPRESVLIQTQRGAQR